MTREEAIRMLSNRDAHGVPCGYTSGYQEALDMAIEALQAEPVKHGEWVASRVGESSSWFVECSECHVVMPPVNYTYCPNCGSYMRGGGKC